MDRSGARRRKMINSIFKIKAAEETKNYAKFVIGPLEQGYGHTLGNALRRCLLSSIPGAAITKLKIEGIRHQFTTLKYMKEDIVELILNLKQVRVFYQGDKEVKLTLNIKGPKEVKAGDIKTPVELKIFNKDLALAELTDKKATLNLELWVQTGYGYSSVGERKTNSLGIIPIDAVFSPITQVNYKIEAMRVGKWTNRDSLILEIWSDGTIKPREALEKAAKILVDLFSQIYNPVEEKEEKEIKEDNKESEALKLTVEELNLPTRIANALRKGGYSTIKDLTLVKGKDLSQVKNLGVKSIKIIAKQLEEKGVFLKG